MSQPLPSGRTTACSYPLTVLGRYRIANWPDGQAKPRDFACRTIEISAWTMTLAAPVPGIRGKRVSAHMEGLGRLEGSIAAVQICAFEMTIDVSDRRRAQIEAKLRWLSEHRENAPSERRSSARIIPESPHSTLGLPDGTFVPCFIIDMSTAGAAVSADFYPDIGQSMLVGSVAGRVVRTFTEGFAVRFWHPQKLDNLQQLITRGLRPAYPNLSGSGRVPGLCT